MIDMSLSYSPRLRWVLVDGELYEVSAFKDLQPRFRPQAHCPVCERQVTLKLGQKKAHHFAHRPEDICSATQPETALHLNCKFHIYNQLRTANQIHTSLTCIRCGTQNTNLWKQNWDAVEVEHKINTLRPDIALLQNDVVIGAIEIYVTHAVDEEKALRFQKQGVDWIELRGNEKIYEEPDAWTIEKPLHLINQHPALPCPQCLKNSKTRFEGSINNPIRIAPRSGEEVICARMFDIYYRSGKKYRQMLYMKYAFKHGKKTSIWIETEKKQAIASEEAPITKESEKRLSKAFEKYYQELKQKAAFVDDNMKNWIRWRKGMKFVPRDTDTFPFRYTWDEVAREWKFQPHLFWKRLTPDSGFRG